MDETHISKEAFWKFMQNMPEEIAYHHGVVLVGFSIKQKEDTWLLVVRGNFRLDGRKVCFIETETILGCFQYLATWCYKQNVPLKWMMDRFA